ncbi:GNAT family N-acetyltransferase [Microbacterium sp.]|uniref:GNAT family N-acetyltransferase n=1 Tax=Microbacterium sp. TaxID=51671 RepID=UPI003F6ED9E5
MPDQITLTPIPVPDRVEQIGSREYADFRVAVDIRNRISALLIGDDAPEITPEMSHPHWLRPDEEVHGWLLRLDDEVAGRAMMWLPLETGSRRAQVRVEVLPEFRRRGAGRHGLDFLVQEAVRRGRVILQGWTEHPVLGEPEHAQPPGAMITARTGFGAVPDDATARLAARAGFALEQVYRISTLHLDGDLAVLDPLLEEAEAASDGYRYVSWTAPAPEEWVADYAWMKSRMSTDAPAGDSVLDEEEWDAARVRALEKMYADSGMTLIVGAAQHVASGRLVAFTELVSFRQEGKPIEQNDTLVLAEHRGHRLGALVKIHTLRLGRESFPEGHRIVTGNAEENRPMLAVNEAMGFIPTRYSGEWQKIVS